jgi:hypothetical protein
MLAHTADRYNKKLSQEERERRAGGLFVEYTGSHDVAEALLSTQELAAPGFLPKLVCCCYLSHAMIKLLCAARDPANDDDSFAPKGSLGPGAALTRCCLISDLLIPWP